MTGQQAQHQSQDRLELTDAMGIQGPKNQPDEQAQCTSYHWPFSATRFALCSGEQPGGLSNLMLQMGAGACIWTP